MSMLERAVAARAGLLLDRLLGEPPARLHPVVGFAWVAERLEPRLYRDDRLAGAAFCGVAAAMAVAAGVAVQRVLGRRVALGVACAASIAERMLANEALSVARLLDGGDVVAARLRVRSLVGRDSEALLTDELVRAVIESVAENTVDAVTAPVVWALVGGAPAVLAHRAVNTLDAMVGHRTARYRHFGWASARLDDALNWLPARLSVAAVALVSNGRARDVRAVVRRDAHAHPSPNAGLIEAAVAAALEVRLGGTNTYDGRREARGLLGDGRPPVSGDIDRAVQLTRRASTALTSAAIAVGATVQAVRRLRYTISSTRSRPAALAR